MKETDKQFSAIIEIELDSSVLKDAADYHGIPCREVGDNLYSVTITEMDRVNLFHQLASWENVYQVKKITITFA